MRVVPTGRWERGRRTNSLAKPGLAPTWPQLKHRETHLEVGTEKGDRSIPGELSFQLVQFSGAGQARSPRVSRLVGSKSMQSKPKTPILVVSSVIADADGNPVKHAAEYEVVKWEHGVPVGTTDQP